MSHLSQPLGVVLQQAGLVSARQIEIALEEQRRANPLRLGEILARHGWIKQETADFFAQRWFVLPEQKKRPLGQYLKEAALLDDSQIGLIISEQKRTGKRFGEIAVVKEWLEEATVNFFLKHLSPYQVFKLQLEVTECPYTVLEVILEWTNRHPILTEKICQFIERSQLSIATGEEREQVERLIQTQVIDVWQRGIAANHLQTIRDRLLQHSDSLALLLLYQEIWQQETAADGSPEQAALLDIGLVVEHQQVLKVANPIYYAVFNYKWVVLEVARMIESRIDESSTELAVESAIASQPSQHATSTAALRAIASDSRMRHRWLKLVLILAIGSAGAGAVGINVLPRLASVSTFTSEAPSTEPEPPPVFTPPTETEASSPSETHKDSVSVTTFTTGTTDERLRQTFGEPTQNRQGYWSNSRAWLYEDVVPQQVDLGYILDANTGRVRQSEGSFTQAVSLPNIEAALDGMLGESTPPAVRNRLEQIYQRQVKDYWFTVGNLEGVIQRNEQDRIFIAVWEADFH